MPAFHVVLRLVDFALARLANFVPSYLLVPSTCLSHSVFVPSSCPSFVLVLSILVFSCLHGRPALGHTTGPVIGLLAASLLLAARRQLRLASSLWLASRVSHAPSDASSGPLCANVCAPARSGLYVGGGVTLSHIPSGEAFPLTIPFDVLPHFRRGIWFILHVPLP